MTLNIIIGLVMFVSGFSVALIVVTLAMHLHAKKDNVCALCGNEKKLGY